MASLRLLRKTLITSTRYLPSPAPVRFSPPATQKTAIPLPHTVAAGFRRPSATTVFRRMYTVNRFAKAPQPQLEDKKKPEMEKGNEESEMEKENEESEKEKGNEEESKKEKEENEITDFYNTSQKILIACAGDLSYAHAVASKLGDGRNMVVMSPMSCGEMKRVYENSWSHMLELNRLGATIHFNVDIMNFGKDSRVNNTLYDRIMLDIRSC